MSQMEVSGQLHVPAALHLGKIPSVFIKLESGWTQNPVWKFCRRGKFSAPTNNRRTDCTVHILVTIQTKVGKNLKNMSLKFHILHLLFEI